VAQGEALSSSLDTTKKNLRINPIKEENNMYNKNYKVLKKEIKIYTNKWKNILCS
jgi:hypothetical protein